MKMLCQLQYHTLIDVSHTSSPSVTISQAQQFIPPWLHTHHHSLKTRISSFTPSMSRPFSRIPPIQAMKMQGKVVCSTNVKTVSVEVVRLAPHPKYKKRIEIKKKYQAHDPNNRFKFGTLCSLKASDQLARPNLSTSYGLKCLNLYVEFHVV